MRRMIHCSPRFAIDRRSASAVLDGLLKLAIGAPRRLRRQRHCRLQLFRTGARELSVGQCRSEEASQQAKTRSIDWARLAVFAVRHNAASRSSVVEQHGWWIWRRVSGVFVSRGLTRRDARQRNEELMGTILIDKLLHGVRQAGRQRSAHHRRASRRCCACTAACSKLEDQGARAGRHGRR